MSKPYQYAVIGGDARQSYLASMLTKNHKVIVFVVTPTPVGVDVGTSLEETIACAENILAPIPLTKNGETIHGISDCPVFSLFESVDSSQKIYGGGISRGVFLYARKLQIPLIDYMNIEEIAWKNAVATAEGTFAEAIRYYPENVQDSRGLILGVGRCGMKVAQLFHAVGARVTVCVRRKDVIRKGSVLGYDMQSLEQLKQLVSDSDIIINTIPTPILKEEVLREVSKDTLILDIAGKGGGTLGGIPPASSQTAHESGGNFGRRPSSVYWIGKKYRQFLKIEQVF